MISKRKALVWAVILVFMTSFVTYTFSNVVAIQIGDKIPISKEQLKVVNELEKLVELKEIIKKNYVDGADDETLMEGALKGMFQALGDPYSVYMTRQEFKNFTESTRGTYGGIGVIVTKDEDGYIAVVAPIEDTPGEKAGLKTNDRIIKVNDKDIIGFETEAAVSLIKGKAGTIVTLTVMRDKVQEPLTFKIRREEIVLKTVKTRVLDNNIGYLRISMFDEDTGKEFKKGLKNLQNEKIKGLIIDLRQNPGGYVTQCIEVADELLDKGLVVYTEDVNKKRETYYSKDGKIDIPFVILVDEGSASASEIVSGAVKDRKAGLLIGTKTFGKGLVQSVEPYHGGTGYKITTQKYYTPNGISINKVGIEPDILVKSLETKEGQKPEDIKDVQLDRAVAELMKQIK